MNNNYNNTEAPKASVICKILYSEAPKASVCKIIYFKAQVCKSIIIYSEASVCKIIFSKASGPKCVKIVKKCRRMSKSVKKIVKSIKNCDKMSTSVQKCQSVKCQQMSDMSKTFLTNVITCLEVSIFF